MVRRSIVDEGESQPEVSGHIPLFVLRIVMAFNQQFSFGGTPGEDVDLYIRQCTYSWAGVKFPANDGLKDEAKLFVASTMSSEERHFRRGRQPPAVAQPERFPYV